MGSTMKPTIFNDKVATALKAWHNTAKRNNKHNKSENNTPFSSRPATPTHRMSPARLLQNYKSSTADNTPVASPRSALNYENTYYYNHEETPSPSNREGDGGSSDTEERHIDYDPRSSPPPPPPLPPPPPPSTIHAANREISISMSEFSFGK